jgi:beta-galactosidase
VSEAGKNVSITADYQLPTGNHYLLTYTVYPDGVINVAATFTPKEVKASVQEKTRDELIATYTPQSEKDKQKQEILEIPRIGLRFRIPAQMDNIRYFGRGPEENYIDRYKGTMVGIYQAKAWDLYCPYVRPQENGHHTDTRWLSATNDAGKGLLIVGDHPVEFNALRNAVEDFDSEESTAPYQWHNFSKEEILNRNEVKAKNVLRKHTHAIDIVPRDFVEICLDHRQQGVAGYNSWGDRPIKSALLYADQEYIWGFTLRPVVKN